MSNVTINDLSIYNGQHKKFVISVLDELGAKDITLDDIEFKLFEYQDKDPVVTKHTDTITEINKTNTSEITIFFNPGDTNSLESKRYYYQIWNTDGITSEIVPIMTGYFWIVLAAPSIINELRLLLDEAGEQGIKQISNEVVSPISVNTVGVNKRRIRDVQGVWALNDEVHALTNYYIGGGFESSAGIVTLGNNLPNVISDVRISYTWESGIDDDALNAHLQSARIWAMGFSGTKFNYGGSSDEIEEQVEYLARALTIVLCILTINGANVAQMGYNFRIHEFEIQSKLWGEGMIAQALFLEYNNELTRWMMIVGKDINYAWANKSYRYNLNKLIDYTKSGAEGSTR